MMKKYFNLLTLFGAFLMSALLLIACDNNDDDDPDGGRSRSSAIIGEWANIEYGSNGKWVFMEMVDFKRNGSFTSVTYYAEGKNLDSDDATISNVEKEETSGTYTASRGVITLTANGETWEKEYSLKSHRLIIYDDEGELYYDAVTDEIEDQFDKMEKWYRTLNNNSGGGNNGGGNNGGDNNGGNNGGDNNGGGGGGGEIVSNALIGEWVKIEINSQQNAYMEMYTFKNNSTYTFAKYDIYGRDFESGKGLIASADKKVTSGKYKVIDDHVMSLTDSNGKTIQMAYKVDELSFKISDGTYYRLIDELRSGFVDPVERAYQATFGNNSGGIDNNLVGEWVVIKITTKRNATIEKTTFKSDGTIIDEEYAVFGNDLYNNWVLTSADKQVSYGKYRTANEMVTIIGDDGTAGAIPYKVDGNTIIMSNGSNSITLHRMNDEYRSYFDAAEKAYKATHKN